jgi:uncharacterized protein (TIGR00251 family)
VRIAVHVHPGASRPSVGGLHDGALVVRVRERAIDGRATHAVVRTLANAFAVTLRDITLVSGAHSRRKMFEISGDHVAARYDELTTGPLLS